MNNVPFVTIPRKMTGNEELVVLSRQLLNKLLAKQISEADVLRWSREAKQLKRKRKLPILRSLKNLR